jgi:hypothetical protein
VFAAKQEAHVSSCLRKIENMGWWVVDENCPFQQILMLIVVDHLHLR